MKPKLWHLWNCAVSHFKLCCDCCKNHDNYLKRPVSNFTNPRLGVEYPTLLISLLVIWRQEWQIYEMILFYRHKHCIDTNFSQSLGFHFWEFVPVKLLPISMWHDQGEWVRCRRYCFWDIGKEKNHIIFLCFIVFRVDKLLLTL